MNESHRRHLARAVCSVALVILTGLTGLVACSDDNGPSGSAQELIYMEGSHAGPGRVVRVTANGTHRTVLFESTTWLYAVYPAPDGRILVLATEGYFLLPAGGGTAVPFTQPGLDAGAPVWSPDGESIAWTVFTGTTYAIGVAAHGSSTLQVITGDSLSASGANWSPDGERLAFRAQSIESSNFNLYTVGRDGSGLQKITHDSLYAHELPSWSHSGTQIAFPRFDIWTVAPDGTGLRQVTTGGAEGEFQGFAGMLYWSQDDSNLMASSSRYNQIYRVRSANGAQSDLNLYAPSTNPASPDASRIMYLGRTQPDSVGNTSGAIFVAFADGSHGVQVTPDSVAAVSPVWLPAQD